MRITEEIDLSAIQSVPVAVFVGKYDIVATPTDGQWTVDQIGDAVVHYQEINGGHLTFVVGKDVSWFTEDVMGILNEY